MKVPRDISGRDLMKCLCKHWDYRYLKHEGSHIIIETNTPAHQRIPIPDHSPIRLGTLNSILRFVAQHKGVNKDDILRDL